MSLSELERSSPKWVSFLFQLAESRNVTCIDQFAAGREDTSRPLLAHSGSEYLKCFVHSAYCAATTTDFKYWPALTASFVGASALDAIRSHVPALNRYLEVWYRFPGTKTTLDLRPSLYVLSCNYPTY